VRLPRSPREPAAGRRAGTGKTHLAHRPGRGGVRPGRRVRFYRVTELVTQLLEARESGTWAG